jgi:DNA-binding transcriptional ArsR family regulator
VDVFAALADPTRRAIVAMLADGERPAGEIAARFEMSAPAVSQHLKALRAARLVQVRPVAQRRLYALAPEGLDEIARWVADMRRFWRAAAWPPSPPWRARSRPTGRLARLTGPIAPTPQIAGATA